MGITNTEKNESHPEWLFGQNPDAIEDQEKRGQQELVNSTLVPSEIHGQEKLEALGFTFGGPLKDDPIFCTVEMPKGYKKVATDHDMWSEIQNGDGKKVALIFYKAAFYDRKAIMTANI